jgi:hypothetical protein
MVNGHRITTVLIGRHYVIKHGKHINDDLILRLVASLDGGNYPVDSTTNGTYCYAADILLEETGKIYRLIWIFEGKYLQILGVVNAYRRKSSLRIVKVQHLKNRVILSKSEPRVQSGRQSMLALLST